MRELGIRILRRSIPVAIALGLMGYLFAEIYLVLYEQNGGVPNPANQSVKWRAPLTMAGFGVGFLVILECLIFAIRRNQAPHSSAPQKTDSTQ